MSVDDRGRYPLEIRQLRYFLSAVKLGSLKEAAREHFVTQPAVSVQIKKLEEELGEKLFMRRGKGLVPTQAAAFLVTQAEDVLQRIDQMKHAISGFKEGERGILRLGNIDAASIYVLPSVFREFRQRYPGIDMQVSVADSDTLLARLDDGGIELAIVTLPLAGGAFEAVPIYNDKMVLVADPAHPIATARAGARSLQLVAESGLITYPSQSTTRRLIEKVFIDNGVHLRAAMEMSSPEAIKRLTEVGLGPSILPAKIVEEEVRRGTLIVIPTGRAHFARELGVVYRDEATLSPPARSFLRILTRKYRRAAT